MINRDYLEQYEQVLKNLLLEKCYSNNFLDRTLLEVEELDELWAQIVPEYMADAVPQLNDYPTVSVAWAAYFGMAMAAIWDINWDEYKDNKNIYIELRDERGFDNMDEYIIEEVIGLAIESEENRRLEEILRSCAQSAISTIRKEQIEAGTPEAFYIFASTAKIMFKIGVAIELKTLGYHYEKVVLDSPEQIN